MIPTTALAALRSWGYTFRVHDGRLQVRRPRPEPEDAADALAVVRDHKPEVAVLLRHETLDTAFDAWGTHVRSCAAGCVPHRLERCAEGERLAGAYFHAWARWLAAQEEAGRRGG